MRVIQPSVAKRIAFAKWARLAGLSRHSSATWKVPDDVEVPAALMVGAQVDGSVYAPQPAPKRTRTRKRKEPFGAVEEPAPPLEQTDGGFVFNRTDYPEKTQEDD